MTNMTDIGAVFKAADYASRQTDRWLFIATLIVLVVFVFFVAKFFVRQYSNLVQDHRKDQEGYQSSLQNVIIQQNETIRNLVVSLDRNTKAFEEVNAAIQFCKVRNAQQQRT